jgi:ketosteroid isomerase-like protein
VVDWQIDFTDEDGQRQHLEGVGLDVMRRGADGVWRFAIDNPFGG